MATSPINPNRKGRSLSDLIRNRKRLGDLIDKVEALERLEVQLDGQRGIVRFSGRNAVVTLGQAAIASTPVPVPVETLHPETIVWRDRAIAAGGTFNADSILTADTLIRAVNATSWNDKLIYLVPFLGGDLITARVPLRDRKAVGISTNLGFVDADYSEGTGLQGNGVDKALDIILTPAQVGQTIGFGWWETNPTATIGLDAYVMGSHDGNTDQTIIVAPTADLFRFQSGDILSPNVEKSTRRSGFLYGQRSSDTLREIFFNGALIQQDTTPDSSLTGGMNIALFAFRDIPPNGGVRKFYAGGAACALVTDGTLTPQEVVELQTLLQTYNLDPVDRQPPIDTLEAGAVANTNPDTFDAGNAGSSNPDTYDGNPPL